MSQLGEWLENHQAILIDRATDALAQDETLKTQFAVTVGNFFGGLVDTVRSNDSMPLYSVLANWVEARSVPVIGELTSLVSVLATLKEVLWGVILEYCDAEDASRLIVQSDAIFTQSTTYLSSLENEALLHDMRVQLHAAQTRLNLLDKSKSNFIAVISHELRTPLTLVEGYIDMLASVSSDMQSQVMIEGIKGGTRRLRAIINDIIDLSLIELQIMEFHFQPVWLGQVVNAADRNVKKAFSERNVLVQIDGNSIPKEPTYGDPDRLLQAVENVLMNAVKYTPDGRDVVIQARELPGFTDVSIIDSGVGIAPENLPHIFDRFSSLGNASLHSSGRTKFKGGGPGLGLPIARGIIEAHGGNIWAESDGHDDVQCPGSAFHILIPMHISMPESPAWSKPNSTNAS
jgi:signal transduction histidine kinase